MNVSTYKTYTVLPIDIGDTLMSKLYDTHEWSARGASRLYFDVTQLRGILTHADFTEDEQLFLERCISLFEVDGEVDGDILFMT